MTKLLLELEFQHKGNKQTEKFSRQEWIQKITLFICYTEKDKNKSWTDLSLLGQEPTLKTEFAIQNNPENLDPSYKTGLDFWNCFGRGKPSFYNRRNTVYYVST